MRLTKKKILRRRLRALFLVLLFALGFFFLAFCLNKAASAFVHLGCFRLKKIYADEMNKKDLLYLRREFLNKPLFLVNLKYLQEYVAKRHPEFKAVKVRRVFPQAIFIDIERRRPYLQVKAGSYFYLLDSTGKTISRRQTKPQRFLITLYADLATKSIGLGEDILGKKFGQIKPLLDYLKKDAFYAERHIKAVYFYSLNDIWFDLEGIRVKIGGSNYQKRLKVLKNLIIPRFEKDWKNISYIDLRFKDPVVGYKR